MSAKNTERARRIAPVPEVDAEAGTADPDYASSFAVDVLDANTRSPEQWARNTLEVHSSLISARKVLRVDHDPRHPHDFVQYENAQGRFLWSAIAPVHHLVEPLLLTLDASRSRRERANERRWASG